MGVKTAKDAMGQQRTATKVDAPLTIVGVDTSKDGRGQQRSDVKVTTPLLRWEEVTVFWGGGGWYVLGGVKFNN